MRGALLDTRPDTEAAVEVPVPHPARAARAVSYGRYLLVVFLLPLLLLLAAFPIARTNWYIQTSRRMLWHGMADHMDAMAGKNCAVVVFGDSTGMVGVNPEIVERETGWKTCNIAIPYMAFAASGDMVLDHYLAENRAPKFIVFATHASHMGPPTLDEESGVIDAWWFADRYFSPWEAARLFLKHPRYSFLFAAEVWQQSFGMTPSSVPDFRRSTYRSDMALLRADNGMVPYDLHLGRDVVCDQNFDVGRPDPAYARSLNRYATAVTRVVFYVSPLPSCDSRAAGFAKQLRALGWDAPLILPEWEFADGRHLNVHGAVENSQALARELLSLDGR